MSQWEGGMGVLPQKIFGYSGVKSCHFRQKKPLKLHFHQSQGSDRVYDDLEAWIRIWQIFKLFIYNTGERSEPEKKFWE